MLPLLSESLQFSNLYFDFEVEHYKSSIACRLPLFSQLSVEDSHTVKACEVGQQFWLDTITTSYIPIKMKYSRGGEKRHALEEEEMTAG